MWLVVVVFAVGFARSVIEFLLCFLVCLLIIQLLHALPLLMPFNCCLRGVVVVVESCCLFRVSDLSCAHVLAPNSRRRERFGQKESKVFIGVASIVL